jgi:hypothetical protein
VDVHIDDGEVAEYADHFVHEAQKLVGLSPLVDMNGVIDLVRTTAQSVADELAKQGVNKSGLRGERKGVKELAPALSAEIERFHGYLRSLDAGASVDPEAFFPGGKLGRLAQVKPADLVSRASTILRGFGVPANANMPDAAKWQASLTAARDALQSVVLGKSSKANHAVQRTAALVTARDAFLDAYNGIAKRVVMAVLIHAGRRDERRLYFKDLQVNEGPGAKPAPAPSPAPSPSAAPSPAPAATPPNH